MCTCVCVYLAYTCKKYTRLTNDLMETFYRIYVVTEVVKVERICRQGFTYSRRSW